uniref:RUN domain-containing protein n=1 Tax=Ditylenchus dipsaci TaxID=166011 RepID=A0A915CSQ2_9BILA
MDDLLISSKTSIRQELDAVTKLAVSNYSLENPLTSETIQALCNNFWPFVSKFTHKSIKYQISTLKQIKNEVGKARAWIRIVLSEGALESYIHLLLRDEGQLRSFYLKSAFIRDQEQMDAFNGWTPTPLILAGLIKGKPNRVTQPENSNKRNVSSNSLDFGVEEAEEIGTNASDLLDGNTHSENIFSVGSPSAKKLMDDDEKSSVYSHPSMLDGAMTSFLRPTFNAMLSSTPENFGASSVVIPSEELSTEVIVHRRRTRFRHTSKSSSDRSRSQSINRPIEQAVEEDQFSATNLPNECETIEDGQLEENFSNDLQPNNTFNDIPACSSSNDVPFDFKSDDGRNDSGIEQNGDEKGCSPVLSPENVLDFEEDHQTSLNHAIFDIATKDNAAYNDISYMTVGDQSYNIIEENKLFGTSLHDELSFSLGKEPELFGTSDLSSALDSVEAGSRTTNWNITPPKNLVDKQASCSSSTGTDFSGPVANLNTALKNFVKKSEKQAHEANSSSSSTTGAEPSPNLKAAIVDPLRKSEEIATTSFKLENTSEEDVVVIEEKCLEGTDEYGSISKNMLLLTRIPLEKGLNSQEFRCPSCRKSIGGSFSSFKLCNLDGRYYCEDCWRRGDESIIPSRVILNWDCKPRPICKASKAFLKSVADHPLLRIDKLNPRLYEHSKQMKKILNMRTKLSLAVMYLLSCKQSIAEDIKRRAASCSRGLWPSDYLYTDIHLYSITDLENVICGSLERRLNSLITFAVNHIFNCPLCLQKGFFCELCSSKHVIYPFQIEVAHRCKACFSVYHIKCISKNASECPKCLRRRSKFSFSSAVSFT